MNKKYFFIIICVFIATMLCSCDSSKNLSQTNSKVLSDSKSENESIDEPTYVQVTETYKYVGNKNSMKFHLPDCRFVSLMNENNKVFFECSREQVVSEGFSPCEKCCP